MSPRSIRFCLGLGWVVCVEPFGPSSGAKEYAGPPTLRKVGDIVQALHEGHYVDGTIVAKGTQADTLSVRLENGPQVEVTTIDVVKGYSACQPHWPSCQVIYVFVNM